MRHNRCDVEDVGAGNPVDADKHSWPAVTVALAVVCGTFFLISPDPRDDYPGLIPWAPGSALRALMGLMSLGGSTPTARGIEIKDLVLHVGAGLALGLAGLRMARSDVPGWRGARLAVTGASLLGLWVAISALSALWSGDASLSLRQAGLYFVLVGCGVGLAATLRPAQVRTVLDGYLAAGAAAAVLCIWYFHERNPNHRPGFPIGNPGTLAATLLPAVMVGVCRIARGVRSVSVLDRGERWRAGAAALALVPLGWCLWLTAARAAGIGLAAGVATLVLVNVGRRMRYVLSAAAGVLVTAAALAAYFTPVLDLLDRSETIRFRGYMWRYAAELWSRRPVSGVGAASFARLTGVLSLTDRQLDPAAFLGDWAGHAHNELFEVFAEIGLLGGVAFVGGLLASGLAMYRQTLRRGDDRWWRVAILASLAALTTEMLFNVSLRLPGVPAAYATLLGLGWAACQGEPRETDAGSGTSGRAVRAALGACAGLLSLLAFGIAGVNWAGVTAERAAYTAMSDGEPDAALQKAEEARLRLFDPLRALYAEELAVRARLARARAAYGEARAADGVDAGRRAAAVAACGAAFDAAVELHARAPTLSRMPAFAARAAEMIADLLGDADPAGAAEWRSRALEAWHGQRNETPYDTEALLALLRYGGPGGRLAGLLRDALRGGFAVPEWQAGLRHVAAREDFRSGLEALLVEAGPIDPATSVDAIMASRAPESFRLGAAVAALDGDCARASRLADRAAALYRTVRRRLPELYSVARAEQAEYEFRADAAQARRAATRVEEAISALPRIQAQHYDAMAEPYRRRLATYLLAAGDEAAAEPVAALLVPHGPGGGAPEQASIDRAIADLYVGLAESFVRTAAERRPALEPWLAAALRRVPNHARAWWLRAWLAAEGGDAGRVKALLRDATGAGVAPRDVAGMRESLLRDFPDLRTELDSP